MSNILKKPYEISIWEDVLERVNIEDPETSEVTIKQYYKENQLAIIGSDSMDTPIRAFNPILTQNVNGSSTLTFTIYYKYYDEELGELVDNPFAKLLVNERKIKLKYDNKWYDFIIKNIQENSENKTFTYTAKDLFINELSKNGFNLQLDTELENNQGTIIELAEYTLGETDWKVDKENSEIVQQFNEEALYEIALNSTITVINMQNKEESIQIAGGKTVYCFYSSIASQDSFVQLLYREDGLYEKDSDRVILNSPNYSIDNVTYKELASGVIAPNFAMEMNISDDYRGDRLVRKQETAYDSLLDKYVSIYKDSQNQELYSYTENEYISPTIIQNFITNASDFVTTDGWLGSNKAIIDDYIYPPINSAADLSDVTFISFLKAKFNDTTSYIYNSGIADNKNNISNFAKDEKYVLRIKYGRAADGAKPAKVPVSQGLRAKVAEYTLENGVYTLGDIYFDFSGDMIEESLEENQTYPFQYTISSCLKEASYGDLLRKKIGLFLYIKDNPNLYYSIQEIQFFPYKTDKNDEMVTPGSTPDSAVKTIYYFYYPDSSIESVDDIVYAYKGEEKPSQYIPVYNEDYEKIRSITVSESNRFNIIQTLCETFECWAKFTIEHNEATGEILLDENYRQKKWVSFHNYIGQDNDRGFRYGINLKSIQRTLDSEQIVSKIVVKSNSNEFAQNGFCTIARAQDNPTKENFLLNFNYYIQQGLLDFTMVNNDLYLTTGGYIGYYTKLRQLNQNRDSLITEQSEVSKTVTQLTAQQQTYGLAADEAEENLSAKKAELKGYCGYTYEQLTAKNPNADIKKKLDDPQVQTFLTYIKTMEESAKKYRVLADQAETNLTEYSNKYDEITTELDNIASQKEELNQIFYNKYSRFIQEGSWISEDYIDDNLYYLDAETTLNASASPKITYTINVLELSQVEGYENYTFHLGDKTYIEDTEFFGWTIIDGAKTPYQEEIVISEISNNLDSPESNQIKVQNYKTQFEDLFQRITATTQAIEYQSGSYGRAADAITTEGYIKPDTLQNSFINNSLILANAKDQSVIWDDTGITITSLTKPNEIVRLVSGGILLTNNGGETWSAGITGSGINANHITAGQIDASRVNIIGGTFSAFRWDKDGLNAYKFSRNEITGEPEFFNFGQFVRFDQWGIYGVRGEDSFIPTSEDDIRENADFGLTWKGFFLKSNHRLDDGTGEQGRIEISSEDDFSVIDGNDITRVKIGLLDTAKYGLRLFDDTGAIVMETDDVGQLFLKQRMLIGPDISTSSYKSRTQLGIIESYTSEGLVTTNDEEKVYSKIFSVKDLDEEETIVFYDNGQLKAKNVDIEGHIIATSGKIGNLTIEDIQNGIKRIEITSNEGNLFKVNNGIASPSQLTLKAILTNISDPISTNFQWEGSNNYSSWTPLGSTDTYIFSYDSHKDDFDSNGIYFIRVTYTDTDGAQYSSSYTISVIDISIDASTTIYEIELNEYEVLKFIDNTELFNVSPETLICKGLQRSNGEIQYLTNTDIDFNIYLKDTGYASSDSNLYADEDGWILLNGQVPNITDDSEPGTLEYELIDSPLKPFFSFNSAGTLFNADINSLVYNELTDKFSTMIKQILRDSNTVFKIELTNISKTLSYAVQVAPMVFGTSKDMATFTLSNVGITAAIQNATMEFTANGLTIYDSGLEIISGDQTVLEVDEDGNLLITGIITATDGHFHGTIDATAGNFTGTINALNGNLGSLSIDGVLSLNNIYIDGQDQLSETLENEYELTTDTEIDYYKKYFINSNEKYTIIDLTTLVNPSQESWYEFNDISDTYILTTDSKININKSYYSFDEENSIYNSINLAQLKNPSSEGWYENRVVSYDNPHKGIYSYEYLIDSSKGFYISDSGEIFASSIVLGEGASIQKYIRLNNAWIFNPDAYDTLSESIIQQANIDRGDFIVVNYETTAEDEIIVNSAFVLNTNGSFRLGSKNTGLLFDGVSESIQSIGFNSYKGWKIDNDVATFNNIVARGSIKSSVLEYGEIQSIGGIVIVRPSSIIKSLSVSDNSLICIVENATTFSNGDYVRFENNSGYYLITNIDGNQITISIDSSFNSENLVGTPLVDFGKNGSVGISINSSENSSLVPANSISIFRTTIEEDNTNLIPEIILGQIPIGEEYGNLQGQYGLYAENVYLKGSMIAKGENFSSGINTESEARETDPNFENRGKILLWAGADGDSIEQIERAKFRVDTYGNLYAGSGYFNGTIITDATITAAEIKTATITGWGKDENNNSGPAALTIRDTNVGILFKDGNTDKMVLRNDKLTLNMDFEINGNFSFLEDSSLTVPIVFVNNTVKTGLNTVILEPNRIGFSNKGVPEDFSNIPYQGYFTCENNSIKVYDATSERALIATFQKVLTTFDTDILINKNVSYANTVEYIQVTDSGGSVIGYDLYIKE